MRSSAVASALLFATAASVATSSVHSRVSEQDVSSQIIALTNSFRQNESLARIEPDEGLALPARYFADYMARTDQYGHSADGQTPATRARKFGYAYCMIAENIAYVYNSAGFTTGDLAHRLFSGWQKSPGHRKNLLDPNVTEIAVAIAQSTKTRRYYAVQLFGRPQSKSIEFKVENRADVAVEYVLDGQPFALPPRVTRTHEGCKPPEVAFRGKATRPTNGQRLIVVNDRQGVRLQAQ